MVCAEGSARRGGPFGMEGLVGGGEVEGLVGGVSTEESYHRWSGGGGEGGGDRRLMGHLEMF